MRRNELHSNVTQSIDFKPVKKKQWWELDSPLLLLFPTNTTSSPQESSGLSTSEVWTSRLNAIFLGWNYYPISSNQLNTVIMDSVGSGHGQPTSILLYFSSIFIFLWKYPSNTLKHDPTTPWIPCRKILLMLLIRPTNSKFIAPNHCIKTSLWNLSSNWFMLHAVGNIAFAIW